MSSQSVGSGTPHLRLQQAPVVEDVLLERRSLRAERAAIDGMVGIALDVDDLGDRVLGLVAQGVDDHATTDGTIRTGAARLAGAGNLEGLGLSVNRSQIKAEGGETGSAEDGAFEKSPARELHLVGPRAGTFQKVTEVNVADANDSVQLNRSNAEKLYPRSDWIVNQGNCRENPDGRVSFRTACKTASCQCFDVTNRSARFREQDRNGGLGLKAGKNAAGKARQSKRRWKELEFRLA